MNRETGRSHRIPLLRAGFRPFYLLAAGFAAAAMASRLLLPDGPLPGGYLSGTAWHAHEMVFGFGAAVLAGFLFTAARSWTGGETPTGGALAALCGLWIAGRALAALGPAGPAIAVDCLFLVLTALVLARLVLRARNLRNLPLPLIVLALAGANLLFHLSWTGRIAWDPPAAGAGIGLGLFALLVGVMGGRVIPAFTANAVPSARPRRRGALEAASLAALAGLLAVDLAAPRLSAGAPETLVAWLAGAGCALHLLRLALWDPLATRGEPLLWALPLAYAWLPAALLLRCLSAAGAGVPEAAAWHALGAGTMGCLMLAMMARSALGHTGRLLAAGPWLARAFLAAHLAALVRVAFPLALPEAGVLAVDLAGALWIAAFVIFLAVFWPALTRARVDGEPG